jgi:hypothetical protein
MAVTASLFGVLLAVFSGLAPAPAWGEESGGGRFQGWYRELREQALRTPFGVPLAMRSDDRNDQVVAAVQAIVEHPFDTVRAALISPASWCDILPLNVTIKACAFQPLPSEIPLTLYVGPKHYQSPQDALAQPYRFVVQAREPGTLSVSLSALNGIYGTTAHRFELEAGSVDGRTVIALHSSYVQSAASKLATAVYLATLGRNKVGFTREDSGSGPPRYVKGLRGMVERNIMRYYLAFEAYLDTQSVPAPHRLESRLNMAYELMERYPLQLHDLEKKEYLDIKRRERENQLRLQPQLGAPAPFFAGH